MSVPCPEDSVLFYEGDVIYCVKKSMFKPGKIVRLPASDVGLDSDEVLRGFEKGNAFTLKNLLRDRDPRKKTHKIEVRRGLFGEEPSDLYQSIRRGQEEQARDRERQREAKRRADQEKVWEEEERRFWERKYEEMRKEQEKRRQRKREQAERKTESQEKKYDVYDKTIYSTIPYEELLKQNMSDQERKIAFKQYSLIYHPDKNRTMSPKTAQEYYKSLKNAFEIEEILHEGRKRTRPHPDKTNTRGV